MSAVAKIETKNEVAAIPQSDSRALMAMIERAAMSPEFDVAKLQQLLDVRDRWEAKEARKAFDAALSAAKAEIKPIIKNREVDFTSQKGRTRYDYEDLAQIAEHVDPILSKHGLSYRHRPKQEGKKLFITCILSHQAGHSEETTLSADNDDTGNKNGIQGIGSTATFLQRYTLKLALGLSASKDDDGRSSEKIERITDSQAADIRALIGEVKADEGKFLRYLKVKSIEDIPAQALKHAVSALEAKRGR